MKKHDEHTLQTLLQDPHKQREAFEEVVRTYSPQLYWQIRRLVFSHDDADDLLQNTFLKAWSNLNTFRGDSRLSTWLYRIALNDPEASIISNLQSDPYFDGDETDYQLQQALSTLPDKQRAVFNMKYYQEMKYEEMSDILHTSVGALKASYHIAVKKIEAFFANID